MTFGIVCRLVIVVQLSEILKQEIPHWARVRLILETLIKKFSQRDMLDTILIP